MRVDGWEKRLDAVIEDARARPYRIGEHDCFRLACAAVRALTYRDRWPEFSGRYATRREALRLLGTYGSSFEAAGDKFFGVERSDVKLARRGDIMLIVDDEGEKHLGVCLGAQTAGLGVGGLMFLATLACAGCWRVD